VPTKAVFPAKLKPLFDPFRYKVVYGGRGSGKSWGVARWLLLDGARSKLRILCTREIQKSIQDSVHKLLADQIASLGLSGFYDVQQTIIRGKNDTEFVFAGLQQHTVDSIKSYEGVDRAWCEEAHSISKRSWDVLIPTIREAGSQVAITFNPQLESDDTYVRFVKNTPPNAVVIKMDWSDNKLFTGELDAERLHAKSTLKPEVYAHIWEGQCMPAVDGAIYFDEVSAAEREGRIREVPADPLLKTHAVWDLGWNDSMAIVLVQRSASELRIVDYIEDSHRTLDDYVRQLKAMPLNWGTHYLPHDGFAKDFKTGKSAQEILEALGCSVEQTPNMPIEEGIRAARMVFGRVYFDKSKAARLLECLKRYRRHINRTTNEAGAPLHDAYSHGADAWRYTCVVADSLSNSNGVVKPIQYRRKFVT